MGIAVADVPCIRRGECYRLADFQRITGKGRHAMRAARAAGLHVDYDGVNAYVSGDEWFRYLESRRTVGAAAE